ncbi:hypothetical protein GCM10017044_25530 [Kordiimonas sediminis]|uniref:DUF6898 domain-containing protein n=1 Tax=Kordiimonas sediminis TaxID=1735581 RepID=A0A919AWK3_9PROT|nr:hypothetical protein [Kordiimonas sediminis]GHF29174.1 hypothetical protein GCM10017044_25530 [Kordiimonas sediminis]
MASTPQDVIIEFITIGNAVKVTAVCTVTGREVSIVGDPKASKKELENLAVRKLAYVLQKDAEKNAPSGGKGILA